VEIVGEISNIFEVKLVPLVGCFRYLGFILKKNKYECLDWKWIIKKFEKKLNLWTHRWLNLSGRLVMIKTIKQVISA